MNVVLLVLLSALLATGEPPAATNAVVQTAGAAARTPDPRGPIEEEYHKIMEMDDAAQDEVERWIRGEAALNEKKAALEPAQLAAKVEARLQPVRDAYEDFLKRHPDHARARVAYGSFLNDTRDEAGAFAQWEKARELDPKNPAVWNNLANYHGHCGPVRKSFEYYAKAIELNPSEPIYYQNLATTVFLFRKDAREFYSCDEQQVFDRALELYHKALKLDPKNFALSCDLAQTYYGIRPARHDDALKAWQSTLPLAQTDVEREAIHIHLARTLINMRRFDEAKQHLDRVGFEGHAAVKARLLRTLEQKKAQPDITAPAPVAPKPEVR